MLAYFQVFHTTRSHFVPILVAQPAPEQLHQQRTTQNAERRTANAPFRSVWAAIYLWACCVHEYFVCCCCLMLPLPLLVDATYTGFGRPGALKTCLIYKMTASPPLPLFRRTFHLDCVRGQSAGVVKSAIHCRCIVAANFTLFSSFFSSRPANLLEVDKMALEKNVRDLGHWCRAVSWVRKM